MIQTILTGSLALFAVPGPARAVEVTDHGVSLAITGILIVFAGLAAISIFIGLMPKVLKLLEPREEPLPAKPRKRTVTPSDHLDEATLTAIAFVLHAESERASGRNLKVTLGLNPSPWALSSQMRILPGRLK
ncbi:MAG: OadG family transporter subunit [Kiritimatiellia bacterium]